MKQKKSIQGLRILKRRTPKGRSVRHYDKEKPDQAICARCEARLQGLPRAIPSVLRHMTRSQRTVNRKFGGVLCNTCVRDVEKYKARMEVGYAVKRDLTIEKFLPEGWFAKLPKKTQEASKKAVMSRKVEMEIAEDVAAELGMPKKKEAPKAEAEEAAEEELSEAVEEVEEAAEAEKKQKAQSSSETNLRAGSKEPRAKKKAKKEE
jgi:large subunit ribosomal protein L34e